MLVLSDVTRTSRVQSLTAREIPLAVEGYLVYYRSVKSGTMIPQGYGETKIIDGLRYFFESKLHKGEQQGLGY